MQGKEKRDEEEKTKYTPNGTIGCNRQTSSPTVSRGFSLWPTLWKTLRGRRNRQKQALGKTLQAKKRRTRAHTTNLNCELVKQILG